MQPRVELSHSLGQGLSRDPIESTPKDGGRTLAVRLQARQHAYRDTRLTQIPHLDCVIPSPSPRHHRMHLPRHRHIQNPAIVALCIQLCALLPRCRRVPRASAIASTSRQNRYSAGARWCVGQEPQIGFARGAVGSALSDAQHTTHNTQHRSHDTQHTPQEHEHTRCCAVMTSEDTATMETTGVDSGHVGPSACRLCSLTVECSLVIECVFVR